MKKIILSLFSFVAFTSFSNIQPVNISGEWKGQRFQFNEEKSAYASEFTYTYTLTQEGNQVKGISKIEQDGAFAEIAVRGFVQGNQFYFEEYEVLNAKRKEGYVWCLKKGILDIQKKDGHIILSGTTPSFMEMYGFECTGGMTILSKDINDLSNEGLKDITEQGADNNAITLYPNPYQHDVTLGFRLDSDMNVKIDVLDIQGRIVASILDERLTKGNHTYTFVPSPDEFANYFFVRLQLGDNVISKPIQKVSFEGGLK